MSSVIHNFEGMNVGTNVVHIGEVILSFASVCSFRKASFSHSLISSFFLRCIGLSVFFYECISVYLAELITYTLIFAYIPSIFERMRIHVISPRIYMAAWTLACSRIFEYTRSPF